MVTEPIVRNRTVKRELKATARQQVGTSVKTRKRVGKRAVEYGGAKPVAALIWGFEKVEQNRWNHAVACTSSMVLW